METQFILSIPLCWSSDFFSGLVFLGEPSKLFFGAEI